MNDFDQQEALLQERRRAYAQQLAGAQAPQGRMVGNTYVAANPLEYLAAGLRGVGAMQGQAQSENELKALQGQRSEANNAAMANALRQLGGAQENKPADGMGPVQQAEAPSMQGYFSALAQGPDYRQVAMQGMAQLPQMEAQKQERIDARAFQQQQAEAARAAQAEQARLTREQRAEELRIRMEDQRTSQQERLQAQKELRQMQIDAQRSTQQLIAGNQNKAPAGYRWTKDGGLEAIPGGPAAGGKAVNLSPTAQKELFEADDAVQNGVGAISSLQKALELNDKAFSGVGASARATIASNLPFKIAGADETVAMDNIIKDQALTSMKSIFGGNPTEGERAILLDLQASASKTPAQRKEILNRALASAQKRVEFNKQKADSLRGGTYMQQGGAPVLAPSAPPAATPSVSSLLEKYK